MFNNFKNNFKFQIIELPLNDDEKAVVDLSFNNDIFKVDFTNTKFFTLGDLKRFQYFLQSLIDDSIKSNGTLTFTCKEFEVDFHKKYDVRNESSVLFVDPNFGVIEYYIDFKINLKNKGRITKDYIFIHMNKDEVIALNEYIKNKITI